MKCTDCPSCHEVCYRRWNALTQEFKDVYVHECWGVREPFEITDINRECTEYPEKRNAAKGVGDKMIDWKIFRAGRGEGKTKWLLDRAVDAYNDGCELYYVGSQRTMFNLVEMWMAETHTMCPIKNIETGWCSDSGSKMCFLTDDLITNAMYVGDWNKAAEQHQATWYATMNKEYFVN